VRNFGTILYEKKDGIAYITLNRPEVLNSYNVQMRDELYQVLTAIRDDADVMVAIFKGAGERAFCVGADLTEFGTAPSPIIARQVRWERDVWGLFSSIKQPLIAALHGYVFGSGVEIALFCDIRIASEDTIFSLPEVSLGMIPILSGNTIAIRYAKEAITRGLDLTLEDGLALERRLAYILKDLDRKDASPSITGATA